MNRLAETAGLIGLIGLLVSAPSMARADEPRTRGPASSGTIVIGSKNFTENRILAEIMAHLIEAHTDLTVERRANLGGTQLVFGALRSGEIDIYPEYTGTGWSILLKNPGPVTDSLRAYVGVRDGFEARFQLTWLSPFGFSNSYALAMPEARAKALGIRRVSDLLGHQEDLRVGFSHEFLNREDGYPGLQKHYGLNLGDLRGIEHGLAYEGLASGTIDVVDTWTTDGKLVKFEARLLEDDLHFFPPYDAAPVIRLDTLARYPELRELLGRLAFRLSDKKMMALNYEVEERGGSFGAVARAFLEEEGLIDRGRLSRPKTAPTRQSLGDFILSRLSVTLQLTLQHLWLTLVAVLLAIAVAVPVGIGLTRRPTWAPPVIQVTGIIQTIPSLALLAFMIPLPGLGLGARSAIAALFLYALLPIVRNTYTAINEVDPDLLEAARGMGLRDREILVRVELPLAVRTIMAGIRTSTVISVGVATLAAFIGAGGLGDPIITGLQLNDTRLILSGAVPAAILAVIVDLGLGALEKAIAPRGT